MEKDTALEFHSAGAKTIECCSDKSQTQPALVSGIRTRPPAGMMLTKQPTRFLVHKATLLNPLLLILYILPFHPRPKI